MAKGKTSAKVKQATDAELFTVDAAGDEGLRRSLYSSTWDAPAAAHPRKGSGKPLKSEQILAQRSRVPARTSKATPGVMVAQKLEREKRAKITPEVKRRLRGMVKRNDNQDRGLWDVSDTQKQVQMLNGENVSIGGYDAWTGASTEIAVPHMAEDIRDIVTKRIPKPPKSLHSHAMLSAKIAPQAISIPHPGESYNPTMTDHQTLLAAEHAKAMEEEEKDKLLSKDKDKIMKGHDLRQHPYDIGYADEVGSGEEDEEIEGQEAESSTAGALKAKKKKRKTDKEHKRKQVNKLMEAHTRQQARLTKSQRHAVSNLSNIVGEMKSANTISLAQLHKRKLQLAQKLASTGLSDMRSGPARVPKPKQHFLLSEELPESLRQLKMDGNLWSEWLDSSKRRGKVQMERRSFARMTKKKGRGLKEIEKVQWRKFER